MTSAHGKTVLISGASIAGLASAYWLNNLGYRVTVVEQAATPRPGGAAVNVQGEALASARRMGIFAQLNAHRLQLQQLEFKNADDTTAGLLPMQPEGGAPPADEAIEEIEIERARLVDILLATVQHEVEFLFSNRITTLRETDEALDVTFKEGAPRRFDLVLGCDGAHSGVRKLWFANEPGYVHFLQHYSSLTIVDKLLIPADTAQLFSTPGRGIMLNAYQGKTDIIFWFFAENEIPYDYRDAGQQRQIIEAQFAGQGWRTAELLREVQQAGFSYFDKFCQIRMPTWTRGRVALVGDAAYCASPAAGIGASLALTGAATLAAALAKHDGDFAAAFRAYDQELRPFIEEVQANALVLLHEYLIPKTEEAIRRRNKEGLPF
jgi:2-polyprenyl-6-methoxyphenol hydroxylase-like FAD-dependent oxidoreductase